MSDSTRTLDEDNWRAEAEGVINDVKGHVKDIHVAPNLVSNSQVIYLNVLTLEDIKLCVELSGKGFRIVGNDFDDSSQPGAKYFETPYAVLDFISPLYRDSFGKALIDKLNVLAKEKNLDEVE